jgi:hypothetical protein
MAKAEALLAARRGAGTQDVPGEQTKGGVVCSLCGNLLEPMDVMSRYTTVVGGPLPTLYKGVVCTKCHSIICLACHGHPASKPCKKCGGEVLPATADVLPSTSTIRSYLYLLQKSKQPSEAMMQTVLKWWRQKHGQEFEMLGGGQAGSVPASADVYVMTTMMLICDQHGFAKQPDKMGYKIITVDGENNIVAKVLEGQTPQRSLVPQLRRRVCFERCFATQDRFLRRSNSHNILPCMRK